MQPLKKTTFFNTVPPNDHLNLLKDEDPKKIADFLSFTKEDVAKATRLPISSIRYDERIPAELIDRLKEIAVIYELVAEYFKGDAKKTILWFKIKNPALGNISPRDMIRFGRYEKLLKYIQNALAGNNP